MIQLFRVLLPSWKFFDGTSDAAALWYRTTSDGLSFSEWRECLPKTGRRRWKNLFLNARENYLLAAHALLEYLKNDIDSGSDASVSLSLVQNLVEYQIKTENENFSHFQFLLFNQLSGPEVPTYLSSVHARTAS